MIPVPGSLDADEDNFEFEDTHMHDINVLINVDNGCDTANDNADDAISDNLISTDDFLQLHPETEESDTEGSYNSDDEWIEIPISMPSHTSHEHDEESAIPYPYMGKLCQSLRSESAHVLGDCCQDLNDWITALLVLCELEDVAFRIPSEVILKVLICLCEHIKYIDTHRHMSPLIRAFTRKF